MESTGRTGSACRPRRDDCDDCDDSDDRDGRDDCDGRDDSDDRAALAAMGERAEAIRDEQVDRAVARLAATGDLTPERRATVERLADRLVARLVAVPVATLEAAEADDDVETEAVLERFGE